jgi:hypothetical protein
MADAKEWFKLSGAEERFPNQEAAERAAEERAMASDRDVDVIRCTETTVRRYRRQVTVVAEDMPTSLDA